MASAGALAGEGCLPPPAKLSEAVIKAFVDHPEDLLLRHPTGGPALSAEVRRLVASDTSTVAKILELAKEARPEHIVAIGIGLAQAAGACTKKSPGLAEDIKKQVNDAGNTALAAAFAAEFSLRAYALDERSGKSDFRAMGEPPVVPAIKLEDPPRSTSSAGDTSDTAGKIVFGGPDFLWPFNFGTPQETGTGPTRPPFGFGGVVPTSDVVSPTKPAR